MSLAPGSRLGRFEVRNPLGAGGMGEVYVAWDHELERDVAIKVIRDGVGDVRRFIQEAKAASALNHPNVVQVYEIGTHEGLRFIAMEIVDGETLRARITRGALSVEDALDIGVQITAAMAAAHKAGIVHRDIKPENIIIHRDGYAKIVDFGLAKLHDARGSGTIVKTSTGVAMGTLGYMAPEQLAAGEITPACDVYSLGVVLYEMVTGRRPPAPGLGPPGVAPKLTAIIARALSADPAKRYPSSAELHEELRDISREKRVVEVTRVSSLRAPGLAWIVGVLVVAIAGAALWFYFRSKRVDQARALITRAEQFYLQRDVVQSYEAATAAWKILPNDDRLLAVMTKVTQEASIKTDPPGATVYLQRFKGPATRVNVGTTPLELPRLLRADYLVTVEKPGYAPVTRPLSIAPIWLRDFDFARMPGTLQVRLIESSKVPPGMVAVAGGPYRLQGWYRATDRVANLGDFFIDRYEVSNADYEAFMRDGGYRRPELWKSLPIPFEEAKARFRDSTGLPGPRGWSGGISPRGRENHPVTDVTWYEAAAFAEWKGKKLPTIYQWERAGRYPGTRGPTTAYPWGLVPAGVDVTERANFLGQGTVPVATMPFGMSTWGAHHMAGNVSEWVRNEKPPGHAARGGSWNDATYAFGQTGAFPPFYSSPTTGFRCVIEGGSGESGDFALPEKEFAPTYQAIDDNKYRSEVLPRYEYQRTPLAARVIESVKTADWTREKIVYGVGGKTVIAYLYLPRGFDPPFQVIYFAPAGDVDAGLRSLAASIEAKLAPHIRIGRAVFAVALEGYVDRPAAQTEEPQPQLDEYVDYVSERVTEMRRGLDYIETRPELDKTRVAFEADSAGVWAGVVLCAVDDRFRSVLFVGSGIRADETDHATAANRINFLPRIKPPKLLLQGKYDESTPYTSEFEPLFKLMREPKRAIAYEGPHSPPRDVYLRESQKWFDETLGPVK